MWIVSILDLSSQEGVGGGGEGGYDCVDVGGLSLCLTNAQNSAEIIIYHLCLVFYSYRDIQRLSITIKKTIWRLMNNGGSVCLQWTKVLIK